MAEPLDTRAQLTLFALLAIARPATNRELRETAGLQVEAATRRTLAGRGLLSSTRMGATTVHAITPAGTDWCRTAMAEGRPRDAKYPCGVLYALLGTLGTALARDGRQLDEVFRPDLETWIRAGYAELTVRRPGQYVRLSRLRHWVDGVAIDDELDRMIEMPDVHLKAELDQRKLTPDDRAAAVEIGGEPRHLIRIGPA